MSRRFTGLMCCGAIGVFISAFFGIFEYGLRLDRHAHIVTARGYVGAISTALLVLAAMAFMLGLVTATLEFWIETGKSRDVALKDISRQL